MSIVNKAIQAYNSNWSAINSSISKLKPIERVRFIRRIEDASAIVLIGELWKIYFSGEWLAYNTEADADSRTNFQHFMEFAIYGETEIGKGQRDYIHQRRKIIDVLTWLQANYVEFESERITPEALLGQVPISVFNGGMSVWNQAQTDEERAWVITQWFRRDAVITPLADLGGMVIQAKEPAEIIKESDGHNKPLAVLKQDKNGRYNLKITSADSETMLMIKNLIEEIVQWVVK